MSNDARQTNYKGYNMFDSLDFECVPHTEQCAQVGTDWHYEVAKIEAKAMIAQLGRMFPAQMQELRVSIKSNSHDFGNYLTIQCRYECDSEDEDLAYQIENDFPSKWDEPAKAYLKANLPKEYLSTLEWAE